MHLIIAEKNIVAERIAAFLAGKDKVKGNRDGTAVEYAFDDTVVIGLRGHVVEVDFVDGYKNWRSIDHPPRSLIDAEIVKIPTEKKIISKMQKHARKASRVTIATDFDTEGELIGKEAYELVRSVNKNVLIDRARFSAVTKSEIIKSIEEAEPLDMNLAAAGESRQIIDLVWGASLTRFLSIAAHRGADNILSVGRVQSPTLTMIVDREREIEAFVPTKYWQLAMSFVKGKDVLEARHTKGRFTDYEAAKAAFDETVNPVAVTDVITGHKTDKAPAPLDTTALIVGAGRLGISASYAMNRAEDLYMRGFISYPRTDNTEYPKSLNVKEQLKMFSKGVFASDAAYVYSHLRATPTRGKKSTTDHPPIYPTSAASKEDIGDEASWKIYEFVVRRFFATLSTDAEWETMKVNLSAGTQPYTITGGRLLVSGWREVYPYSKAEENILPEFVKGEPLRLYDKRCDEKETQPPARYSQSRLIQRMEELGLGTKSTRHEVISKLAGRKYIEGNPMKPTTVGRAVTEALKEYAATITEPEMTKTLEGYMNDISNGKTTIDDVLKESRHMLNDIFDELEQKRDAIGNEIFERTRQGEIIGSCPVCGSPLHIRRTGSSQFIGCGGYPNCSFNISLPPATWGNAVKTNDVCEVHNLNHVQLLRKGAPPWKLGCPLCSHLSSHSQLLMQIPGMSEETVAKLQASHVYSVYDMISTNSEKLAKILGISKPVAEKLIESGKDVIVSVKKRSEMKKFVSKLIPPKRGRSHTKVTGALADMGISEIADLAKADPEKLTEAKLSPDEANTVVENAKYTVNYERMKEFGVPSVTLKKYSAAGFLEPEKFISVHPAGISLITAASVETVCKHQKLVAEKLCRPAPEKISKAAFEKGIEPLKKRLKPEILIPLALAGVYSPEILDKADVKTLAKVTGISAAEISKAKKTVLR